VRMLRTGDRLGIGQRRQGLVWFCREDQTFEGATEPVALVVLLEERIGKLAVGFERTRGRGNGGGGESWLVPLTRSTPSTNYR